MPLKRKGYFRRRPHLFATGRTRPYRASVQATFIFVEFGYGGRDSTFVIEAAVDHNQHPFPLSPARQCIRIKASALRKLACRGRDSGFAWLAPAPAALIAGPAWPCSRCEELS